MRPVTSVKTLQINGRDVTGRQEESILSVARQNGIFIPRLCEMDGLTDVGACRLCLVEIKGQNKLLPACVTAVEEGMEVTTDSPRLQNCWRSGWGSRTFTFPTAIPKKTSTPRTIGS